MAASLPAAPATSMPFWHPFNQLLRGHHCRKALLHQSKSHPVAYLPGGQPRREDQAHQIRQVHPAEGKRGWAHFCFCRVPSVVADSCWLQSGLSGCSTFSPTAPGFPIPPGGPCGPSAPGGPDGPLGPGGPGGPWEKGKINFRLVSWGNVYVGDENTRMQASYHLSNITCFSLLTRWSRQALWRWRGWVWAVNTSGGAPALTTLCPPLMLQITCKPTGPGGPGKPRGPSSPFWPKRPCCPLGPGSPSAP